MIFLLKADCLGLRLSSSSTSEGRKELLVCLKPKAFVHLEGELTGLDLSPLVKTCRGHVNA
jgi:hypothetical protein